MFWIADMMQQAAQPATKPEKVQGLIWMWVSLFALGIILVATIAATVSIRRARRQRGARSRKQTKRIPDAWAEAGRRVEPIRLDEPPPEVLPEDRS